MIALLPKSDGGRRPIGLFPSVIRIWMRARAAKLRQWEREHNHPALYGSASRAATKATWISAWEAEAAKDRGALFAQALLDLTKAFETVPHQRLWEMAQQKGYPLKVLRLALAAYRLPRAIGADGVYSRKIQATRGITAGSGTATAELRILILQLLDILEVQCPDVSAKVFVDDINLESTEEINADEAPSGATAAEHRTVKATRLAANIAKAVNCVIKYFEELRMDVSEAKSVYTANMPTIAKMAQTLTTRQKVKALEVSKGHSAKMLGVGTTGAVRRTMKSHNKRVKALQDRVWHFQHMGQLGFSKTALARATVTPATCYGMEVTGASNSSLRRLRSTALRTVASTTQGGCLEAEWLARDGEHGSLDPAFQMHSAPITFLASAWWDEWRTADQLGKALADARAKLAKPLRNRTSLWARAIGPSSAALLSAGRLGWSINDNGSITTDVGTVLELGVDPPAAINAEVHHAVRRWRAANLLQKEYLTRQLLSNSHTELPEFVAPHMADEWRRANAMSELHCNLDDFTTLLKQNRDRSDSGWKKAFGPYLLSAVSNKQWPHARVVAARNAAWSTDPNCQLCNDNAGTLSHRHSCPCVLAEIGPDANAIDKANMERNMSADKARLWTTRGLGAFRIPIPAVNEKEWLSWIRKIDDATDEKQLTWYVDASQIDSESQFTRRFGFGMVAIDQLGRLKAAALGSPPDYVQTIAQAEAHAIAMVLCNTASRAGIVTDCQSNTTLLQGGLQAATNGKKRAARTWRIIANAVDWDDDAINLRWMPAHTAWANIPKGNGTPTGKPGHISRIDWQCNRAVDLLAKIAAAKLRTDWATRNKLHKSRIYTKSVRCRLGAVTWASQSITQPTTLDDGTTRMTTKRDSVGKPAGNAPRRLAKKRSRKTQDQPSSPTPAEISPPGAKTVTAAEEPPQNEWAAVAVASDKLLQACKRHETRMTTCRKIAQTQARSAPRKRKCPHPSVESTTDAPRRAKAACSQHKKRRPRSTRTTSRGQGSECNLQQRCLDVPAPSQDCITARRRHAELLAITAAEVRMTETGHSSQPHTLLDLCSNDLEFVPPQDAPAAPTPASRDQLLQSLRSSVSHIYPKPTQPSSGPSSSSGDRNSANAHKRNDAPVKRHLPAASSVKQSNAISRFLSGSRK